MSASDRAARIAHAMLAVALLALPACGAGDGAATAAVAAGPAEGGSSGSQPQPDPSAAATAPGVLAAGVGAAADTPAGFGTRELAHPEDLQMLLLGYRLEGRQPPIAEWAAAQHSVATANEFERAEALKREQARLQAVYDGTEGVGLLRMNVNARLSEYDGSRGGYYLDAYTAGSVFRFSTRPAPGRFQEETVSLRIDNPGELNFWALDPAAAQEALAKNGGQRDVSLDSRLRITGVSRRSDGPELSATLQGYTIVSSRYRQPAVLGELGFNDGKGE